MARSALLRSPESRRLRAERILDSARRLLLDRGYKNVTIEDVANESGIGKGTVYLHWRSREAMYYAVILRDYLKAMEGFVEDMRHDARETLPHRIVRAKYLSAMSDPLLRSFVGADFDLMARLAEAGAGTELAGLDMISTDYLRTVIEHRVIRPEFTVGTLAYGIDAITTGFLTADAATKGRGTAGMDLAGRAQLLETSIKRTFELEPSPRALSALAPTVVRLMGRSIELRRAHLVEAYDGPARRAKRG